MKLNEYIKNLQALEAKGYGELEVIYAVDDEGNAYHSVWSEPDLVMVEDLEEYFMEVIHPDVVEEYEMEYTPNAILIN